MWEARQGFQLWSPQTDTAEQVDRLIDEPKLAAVSALRIHLGTGKSNVVPDLTADKLV